MPVAAEKLSHKELVQAYYQQQEQITKLSSQNEWYRRQLFGKKSERILREENSNNQLSLGEGYEPEETPPPPKTEVKSYERSHRKNEVKFSEGESKLRF